MTTDADRIKAKLRAQQEADDNLAIEQKLQRFKERLAREVASYLGLTEKRQEKKVKKAKRKKARALAAENQSVRKTTPALCRQCGLPIGFKKVGDKWHPTNLDGSEHWAACAKERARNSTASGKPTIEYSGVITGASFVATECDCLPWDGCYKCASEQFDAPIEELQKQHMDGIK